eukprot:gnl/TRDRNA2_/TRDRNA2_69812_c0_seq1.p1 gnl/TRDRNA2_/TRDRNA2_69812_c0~~gnl/TRDRNA2_/TRDRNA2_69812_c0_seq1.p1  ORF type:complete len:527 (+),score=95.12 gnl/TRDRNA2_/TRDRNA2_69812_c0_seq1:54-1634(+)
MCSNAIVVALAVILQAHAEKLSDNLVDDLFARASHAARAELDSTTIGKMGHIARPQRYFTDALPPPSRSSFSSAPRAHPTHGDRASMWYDRGTGLRGGRSWLHLQPKSRSRLDDEAKAVDASSPQASQIVIDERKFLWAKVGVDIFYRKAECPTMTQAAPVKDSDVGAKKSPVVFLTGFGVGSFHYVRNMKKAALFRDSYSMDWLGQGNSWPAEAFDEGLQLSADLWLEQAHAFIKEVIGEPVYLVGNSLGGLIAAQLAAKYPEDVRGVVLLNATPWWSFRSKDFARDFLWDGKLPAPKLFQSLTTRAFDSIRKESTIKAILGYVYADGDAASPTLVEDIIDAASHPLGPDAYASIIFSPKADLDFADALQTAATSGVKFLMLYGRNDPWVTGMWGQRTYLNLWEAATRSSKPVRDVARYLEITPAGHCPHDEAPLTVAQVLEAWMQSLESGESVEGSQGPQQAASPSFDYPSQFEEEGGRIMRVEDVSGQTARTLAEWAGTAAMRARVTKLAEEAPTSEDARVSP